MASNDDYMVFSLGKLQSMLAERENAIEAILARGESYTIAGRSHGFPQLPGLESSILKIQQAISKKTGQSSSNVRANFNPSVGRGSR